MRTMPFEPAGYARPRGAGILAFERAAGGAAGERQRRGAAADAPPTERHDASCDWPFAGMRPGFPKHWAAGRTPRRVANAPLIEIEFGRADEGYLRLSERRPFDFSAGKRVLAFGVPGACARRPTAKLRHYLQLAAQLGGAAIDEVWCVAIHEPYIVGLWGVDLLPAPHFRLLCDPTGDWTAASGLADPQSLLGDQTRSVEYSLLTLNGAVERVACREL